MNKWETFFTGTGGVVIGAIISPFLTAYILSSGTSNSPVGEIDNSEIENISNVAKTSDIEKTNNNILQADLNAARKNNNILQADLNAARKNNSTLQGDLNTARKNNSTLQGDLNTARKNNNILQTDLDVRKKDLFLNGSPFPLEIEKISFEVQIDEIISRYPSVSSSDGWLSLNGLKGALERCTFYIDDMTNKIDWINCSIKAGYRQHVLKGAIKNLGRNYTRSDNMWKDLEYEWNNVAGYKVVVSLDSYSIHPT